MQSEPAGDRGCGALDMDVPEEPQAAVAVLAVFAIIGFLFLLCLTKGCLSERQQTRVWVGFAVLFFSLCSVLVRGNAGSQAHQAGHGPAPVDTKDVRPHK